MALASGAIRTRRESLQLGKKFVPVPGTPLELKALLSRVTESSR